ncbi:MAG TPA: hypothetical protein VN108_11345 [Marmoricola sp.]|nr:hypothetical protein [Marmoricola sp.]
MKTKIVAALASAAVLAGCRASEPHAASAPTPQQTSQALVRINAQATLIKPYFLPTLEDFARDPFVTAVIEGDVTNAVTGVLDEQDSVGTTLTVDVVRGWGVSGKTIEVTEYGGVLPLRKVRRSFEGKDWQQPLSEADLDRPVEFRMEGFPPTHVGDHVLLLLTTRQDGGYGLAAKLVRSGWFYGWAEGEAPNARWAGSFLAGQVSGLLTAR